MTCNLTLSHRQGASQLLPRPWLARPAVQSTFGWVPIRCPLVTFQVEAMCAFLCDRKKNPLAASEGFSSPPDSSLPLKSLVRLGFFLVCYFLYLLLPFNLFQTQCPARLALSWCSYPPG